VGTLEQVRKAAKADLPALLPLLKAQTAALSQVAGLPPLQAEARRRTGAAQGRATTPTSPTSTRAAERRTATTTARRAASACSTASRRRGGWSGRRWRAAEAAAAAKAKDEARFKTSDEAGEAEDRRGSHAYRADQNAVKSCVLSSILKQVAFPFGANVRRDDSSHHG
jgi:hypothetical protein